VAVQSEAILSVLRAHHAELERFGVRSLLLFGSAARNEATDDSDIDLIVDFAKPVGFFALTRLRTALESWLGREVDLLTADGLPADRREQILREALRAA
jgi:predicted nucleotidyltransferase